MIPPMAPHEARVGRLSQDKHKWHENKVHIRVFDFLGVGEAAELLAKN